MKIVITARNFSAYDSAALQLLRDAGHDVIDLSANGFGVSSSESDMIAALSDADIAISGLEPLCANVIAHCPKLKHIALRSIGYDGVDLDACRAHGISVTRLTGMVEGAVAEHVMAYILYFTRHVEVQNAAMQQGIWNRILMPGAKGRTLGLIGFGGIGKEIARRAVPFGMNVLYTCRHPKPEWEAEYGVSYRSLDALLAESDYISVNVPLCDETRGMFGDAQFAQMKKNCVFINIARGPIVDLHALRRALDHGVIAGAGIDVYDSEPCTDSPLVGCKNAVLTPHVASFTSENFIAMNNRAAQNVLNILSGTLDGKYRLA